MTAVKEVNQGFAHRMDPCVLCSYEVDCENVADLTTEWGRIEHSVDLDDIGCAWAIAVANGDRPASWSIYDRLNAQSIAGILVPSFAPGAERDDINLVLWQWGADLPYKVTVFDPSGRLPKDQLSWR